MNPTNSEELFLSSNSWSLRVNGIHVLPQPCIPVHPYEGIFFNSFCKPVCQRKRIFLVFQLLPSRLHDMIVILV